MNAIRQSVRAVMGWLGLAVALQAQVEYERADDRASPGSAGGAATATMAAPIPVAGSERSTASAESERTSDPVVPLTAKEIEALNLVKRWMAAKDSPVLSDNGQVRFLFGATMPVIVCAPLRGTDIALQPGELVKPDGVHTGDSVRWQVMPSVSGPVGNETTHLIVKPTDVGLVTNMIVGTDRRTYHFELVSRKEEWMPSVGFSYPEENEAEWAAYRRKSEAARTAATMPETGEVIQSLDFNYRIEGTATWKPLRVYNNGSKTVVQMPAAIKAAEAPALLVLGEQGKEQIVNYRVRGDRYIVDLVFQRAVLVLGVGRKQSRITITRTQ